MWDTILLTKSTYEVLNNFDICDSVEAVLIDNTNLSTGAKAGLIVNLENRLRGNILTIGCSLHLNEPPLRKVFILIDGSSIMEPQNLIMLSHGQLSNFNKMKFRHNHSLILNRIVLHLNALKCQLMSGVV